MALISTKAGNVSRAHTRSRLLTGLRILPAALVLLGAVSVAPAPAGATAGCSGGLVAIDGGNVTNTTTLTLSADGGSALSIATGGDNNGAGAGNSGVALAGNGGLANATANGGMIDLNDINSGNNRGNTIAVGGSGGGCGPAGSTCQTIIDGGIVSNSTTLSLSADGGTAVGTANGGDDNLALALDTNGVALAGNGGIANAQANGGTISLGDVNSGNNRGNSIQVARTVCGPTGGGGTGPALRGNGGGAPRANGPVTLARPPSVLAPAANSPILVNGGTVSNSTTIAISADGGTAVSTANGGDGNLAVAVGNGGAALAGNGGTANAQANGGTITLGDINSGGNQGNTIVVQGAGGGGPVAVDGGDVSNSTDLSLSADGGTAISDASGGDDNLAIAAGTDDAALAGNGGIANAEANGGSISLGDVNSGNNAGNTILIGG